MPRISEASWGLVQSIGTGKIYVEQCIDGQCVKRWDYAKLGKTGADLLFSMIQAFDYGYNIRFQFPEQVNGQMSVRPLKKAIPLDDQGNALNSIREHNIQYFNQQSPTAMPQSAPDPEEEKEFADLLKAYLKQKAVQS